jgi:ParB-like chromosome segregation protein Spo0J
MTLSIRSRIDITRIEAGKPPRFGTVTPVALALLRGVAMPPIVVAQRGDRLVIRDGRHRLAAHKLVNRSTIDAWIVPSPPEA